MRVEMVICEILSFVTTSLFMTLVVGGFEFGDLVEFGRDFCNCQ